MGALVAALNKRGGNAISSVITMLDALSHRGTGNFEIIASDSAWKAKSLKQLKQSAVAVSPSAIGHNSNDSTTHDERSPPDKSSLKLIFEGSLFSQVTDLQVEQGLTGLIDTGSQQVERILRELEGSYALAAQTGSKIIVGRDPMGVTPLYYGENNEICAVASERKALWKVGIVDARSFPPGTMAVINQKGFHFKSAAAVERPVTKRISLNHAASRLQVLLERSTQKRVSNVDMVGVAFSGGLDSSVIAVLARNCGARLRLICVGVEGSIEAESVKEAAAMLGLPVTLHSYSTEDVAKMIPKVLWLIEKPDIMHVSVALPLYWTAKTAAKLGCRILLAGQGADELFGGYRRYLSAYEEGGAEKVAHEIYRDVIASHETNFQRDEPVCGYHGVELRLPFIDSGVMSFALSLPVDLNIESANDHLRKRVLRQVAKSLGIPTVIADKPKKAIQFETGVDKTIRKLALDNGSTPHDYLEQIFHKVYLHKEGRSE